MAPQYKASSPIVLLLFSTWLLLSCLSFMLMITTAATITANSHDGTSYCIKAERDALLTFKAGIIDKKNRLSSWDKRINLDCCYWSGVRCDNNIGHVTHLDLQNRQRQENYFEGCDEWDLRGDMSPSLLGLKHLQYLDLSGICFDVGRIPKFLGSLENLLYLDLSYSNFSGVIPHELGNLTKLQYLDLSYMINYIMVDDAEWLSGLSSLRTLILDRVNLSTVSNIMQSLNKLPYIKKVSLSDCQLKSLPQSFSHLNFTSLAIMDIRENNFENANISIPEWLFRISSLRELYMTYCGLTGTIPSSVRNATSLEYLDLSHNEQMFGVMPREFGDLCNLHFLILDDTFLEQNLEDFKDAFSGCIKRSLNHFSFSHSKLAGPLPDWLGDLKNLNFLDLFHNALYGSIPSFMGRLSRLQHLDLGENTLNSSITESLGQLTELSRLYLDGNSFNYSSVITEAHLANLTSLKYISLSGSNLVLNLSVGWLPGFQAEWIYLDYCYLGPKFPVWLSNQVNLSSLVISSAGIEDFLPSWFWNITYTMSFLDLSQNAIKGKLPYRLRFNAQQDSVAVLLSSNLLEGSIPYFPPSVRTLDLQNNSFSGVIPSDIGDFMEISSQLRYLSFSSNNLSGSIPKSLGNLLDLEILDLSNNNLSGVIPNCWNKQPNLRYLILSNNMLEGGVPDTIGSLNILEGLDLSKNNLHGEFPSSLKNCTSLITLALDHNMLMGNIPAWVGGVLTSLSILTLKGNKFSGTLPLLFNLTALHFLDLSHNFFSGTIPQSYGNFNAMLNATNISSTDGGALFYSSKEVVINIYLYTKGREINYGILLSYLKFIDLSENNLSGQIPKEIVNLDALQSLGLSNNHLYGEIPTEIGLMQSLESLDLSNNNLTGSIPSSLSTLHFLESLNLTNNNLSGKIPFTGQLTTFGPSAYARNQNLCGAPLLKNCKDEIQNGKDNDLEDENNDGSIVWFFIGLMPGFAIGFWSVCGILVFKKDWRYTYFNFVDYMYDKVYVMVAVTVSRFT
ncbi:hypothetical protein J5N97_013905 [Dioscorea zingiberensis]|uniref:Leucine-rich repeat-containing N-terminal plant-type domain-containing protein n=1 Tax=Dioscorea zingiberensis TaxID=325984 RepID=A0A9D5CRN3_9LILI|nr:hypothetical protein J5N97_013905 [Dioscorea zingiberensis]